MHSLSISDIQLMQNYGRLVLSHFRRHGIELVIDPYLGGWVDHMARHASNTGVGINKAFDPDYNHLSPMNSFWAKCVNESGEVVSVMAARLLECRDVGQELVTQRLWYGKRCETLPRLLPFPLPQGLQIRGRVCHTGGHWTRPDWRDGARRSRGDDPVRFSEVLPRLFRSLCVVHFDADWLFSVTLDSMNDASLPTGKYGYPRCTHWFDGYFPAFDRSCRVGIVDISREEQLSFLHQRYFHDLAEMAPVEVFNMPLPRLDDAVGNSGV